MAIVDINLNNVQELLVSGTNIKTINGSSILGAGDLVVICAKILVNLGRISANGGAGAAGVAGDSGGGGGGGGGGVLTIALERISSGVGPIQVLGGVGGGGSGEGMPGATGQVGTVVEL